MLVLLLGLVLFLGVHSAQIAVPGLRARVIERRGEGAWKLPYVAVSAVGFVLIVVGYGMARQEPVFVYGVPGGRHIALALLLPVFPLLLAAYLPGRIKRAVRHPMLIAVLLWAVAHLLANGSLADIVLFGSLLVWAVIDLISVSQRTASANTAPVRSVNDLIAIVVGLAIYAALIGGVHAWLFGVSPI